MLKKVCCFGELLLRLSPKDNWVADHKMPFYIGGNELNVAIALANWDVPVKYVTALPDNYLSKQLAAHLGTKKLDASAIHFSGSRVGLYYMPFGTELKNEGVIYDRAHSSFSELKPGMTDWDKVLAGCGWLHFSAISVAVNESVCKEALEAGIARNLVVSMDLNYRSKLWQYGRLPVDVMPAFVRYCDVIMGNIWAAESLLGIRSPVESSIGKTKEELIDAAAESMKQLHTAYPKAKTLAYTFRLEKSYLAAIHHENNRAVSDEIPITGVIDKVGSGDCFMAGLIYGSHHQYEAKHMVDFAAAAAVGKLKEEGDFTHQTIASINRRS